MKAWPSISTLVDDVLNGKVTAVSLVTEALDRIDKSSEYQAIISVMKDKSLKRAQDIDAMIKAGEKPGRLAGVPFIAKDNFLVPGVMATAASNMLKEFDPPYSATAIEKLEDEGAICIAKANLDAFAHGSSTENSDFFVTKNPIDPKLVPGGSSGGSAASVALNIAPFALGTDTGGSIRMPASFCGTVGYKPTYGLVSRSGVVAMASSTDTIGVLTNNVEDAAIVMDVMSGVDPLDSTTISVPGPLNEGKAQIKGAKLGVIKEYFSSDLDPAVKTQLDKAIAKLKKNGAEIEEVSLPSLPLALAVYYIICPAEVASNLSRYDGIRYGYHENGNESLDETYINNRTNGFGEEAKRRIMVGTYVLSSGYYDAYYKRAQTVRTKIINEFNEAFSHYDFLIGPTVAGTAFPIGSVSDPLQMYLNDIMTVAANLSGIPAISIPAGKVNGLPIGMQIMAPQKADKDLLAFAESVEGEIK